MGRTVGFLLIGIVFGFLLGQTGSWWRDRRNRDEAEELSDQIRAHLDQLEAAHR